MVRVKKVTIPHIFQMLNIKGLQMVTLRDKNQPKISQKSTKHNISEKYLRVFVEKNTFIDKDYGDTKRIVSYKKHVYLNMKIQLLPITLPTKI